MTEDRKILNYFLGASVFTVASYVGYNIFFKEEPTTEEFTPVVITCNLQNDFISLKPTTTILNIGKEESKRIIGDNTMHSPIGQFFEWFRAQNQDKIEMIHLKTSWQVNSPTIKKYGLHAIDGTEGQKLILNLESKIQKNEHIINIKSLNVFEETTLEALLKELEKKKKKKLKIGIIGVGT
jgi:nicotinamidase-related amidase